jgi:hypothetical protein
LFGELKLNALEASKELNAKDNLEFEGYCKTFVNGSNAKTYLKDTSMAWETGIPEYAMMHFTKAQVDAVTPTEVEIEDLSSGNATVYGLSKYKTIE